jgi:hypothetical protein
MKFACLAGLILLTVGYANLPVSAADRVLFDFKSDAATTIAGFVTSDATLVAPEPKTGAGLRIQTGHRQPWPGVTLIPPEKTWDLSAYGRIEAELKNLDTNSLTVFCRVDNPGADGTQHCVTDSIKLKPALKGHYAGRSPECLSFLSANLARKYGPDWPQIYPRLTHQRLRSWGLNTIANWSDTKTRRLRLTPYTDSIFNQFGPSETDRRQRGLLGQVPGCI